MCEIFFCFTLALARGFTPDRGLVGWLVGWLVGFDLVAVQSCSGLVSGDCWACSILAIRAGLGFVGGSFRLSKGLISRMLLGGFKVDSESVWVGVGLICARCVARFLQ